MGPPRIPTTIAGDGVSESSQLSASSLSSLIIDGTANAGTNLIDGWNKKIVALVIISLNNLNTKVDNARILLQGSVCEGVKPKSASRFWPVTDKSYALHTEAFDSSIFVFRNGLSSDYVDSADIPIRLLKNGAGGQWLTLPPSASQASVSELTCSLASRLAGPTLQYPFSH